MRLILSPIPLLQTHGYYTWLPATHNHHPVDGNVMNQIKHQYGVAVILFWYYRMRVMFLSHRVRDYVTSSELCIPKYTYVLCSDYSIGVAPGFPIWVRNPQLNTKPQTKMYWYLCRSSSFYRFRAQTNKLRLFDKYIILMIFRLHIFSNIWRTRIRKETTQGWWIIVFNNDMHIRTTINPRLEKHEISKYRHI